MAARAFVAHGSCCYCTKLSSQEDDGGPKVGQAAAAAIDKSRPPRTESRHSQAPPNWCWPAFVRRELCAAESKTNIFLSPRILLEPAVELAEQTPPAASLPCSPPERHWSRASCKVPPTRQQAPMAPLSRFQLILLPIILGLLLIAATIFHQVDFGSEVHQHVQMVFGYKNIDISLLYLSRYRITAVLAASRVLSKARLISGLGRGWRRALESVQAVEEQSTGLGEPSQAKPGQAEHVSGANRLISALGWICQPEEGEALVLLVLCSRRRQQQADEVVVGLGHQTTNKSDVRAPAALGSRAPSRAFLFALFLALRRRCQLLLVARSTD